MVSKAFSNGEFDTLNLSSENIEKAYVTIDNLHHGQSVEHASVIGLIAEMRDINRLQECFEIDIFQYDDVHICQQESVLLKLVWDRGVGRDADPGDGQVGLC